MIITIIIIVTYLIALICVGAKAYNKYISIDDVSKQIKEKSDRKSTTRSRHNTKE